MNNLISPKTGCCNCSESLWNKMGFSPKQVKNILHERKEINYDKGETIVKQGCDASHVLIVKRGIVMQYFEENGKKIAFRLVNDINFAILPFLILGHVQPCSVKAVVPSTICRIKSDVFYREIQVIPKANDYLINWYHNYIHEMYDVIKQYAYFSNMGKMALVIKKLKEEYWCDTNLLRLVDKHSISQIVGISEESASKTLADLKKSKVIDINNKKIEVLNSKELNKLCTYG